MENLFKFYDELSLEDHLYWRIRCEKKAPEAVSKNQTPDESLQHPQDSWLHSQDTFVEVRWQRGKKPFSWAFRTNPQGEWQASSTTLLEGSLGSLGISAAEFKKELIQQILVQIVHAQMVVEVGEKLLGDKIVGNAYRQTKTFLDSVRKMTESYVKHSPLDEHDLSGHSGESTSAQRGIRLVFSQKEKSQDSDGNMFQKSNSTGVKN